ncbi:hypothetical protein Slin14017_G114560 [Septoria linicola]|nr:hypothetical protein Slin14017_G114560 [Septoria linicola]
MNRDSLSFATLSKLLNKEESKVVDDLRTLVEILAKNEKDNPEPELSWADEDVNGDCMRTIDAEEKNQQTRWSELFDICGGQEWLPLNTTFGDVLVLLKWQRHDFTRTLRDLFGSTQLVPAPKTAEERENQHLAGHKKFANFSLKLMELRNEMNVVAEENANLRVRMAQVEAESDRHTQNYDFLMDLENSREKASALDLARLKKEVLDQIEPESKAAATAEANSLLQAFFVKNNQEMNIMNASIAACKDMTTESSAFLKNGFTQGLQTHIRKSAKEVLENASQEHMNRLQSNELAVQTLNGRVSALRTAAPQNSTSPPELNTKLNELEKNIDDKINEKAHALLTVMGEALQKQEQNTKIWAAKQGGWVTPKFSKKGGPSS